MGMSNEPKTGNEINLARVNEQIDKLKKDMYGREMSDGRYHISGRHRRDATELNRLEMLRAQIIRAQQDEE